jgi:hypothetical protein
MSVLFSGCRLIGAWIAIMVGLLAGGATRYSSALRILPFTLPIIIPIGALCELAITILSEHATRHDVVKCYRERVVGLCEWRRFYHR